MNESVLLLNLGLRRYATQEPVDWAFTDAEWKALAEMEAVVKVITDTTTLVQTVRGRSVLLAYAYARVNQLYA